MRLIKSPSQCSLARANLTQKGEPTMLDWEKYTEIANKFQYKAKAEDREDLRQDIIVRLAEVETKYNGNSLTEWGMLRVASYTVMEY